MKRFSCPNCRTDLYFDNTHCLVCETVVAFQPSTVAMAVTATEMHEPSSHAMPPVHLCLNAQLGACNWAADTRADGYCIACRHNRMIPDLSEAARAAGWKKMQAAKRQLFYSILRWQLPYATRAEDPDHGLVFDVLSSEKNADGSDARVLTGHDRGVITLNVAEADDVERERLRTKMREPYRTLLGHFRHEVGHYYWDRLVRDGACLDDFRAVFGDERQDYAAALKRNYEQGPPESWQDSFISTYAACHPWEDFAETWAHYMHIVDSLESARAYGLGTGSSATRDSTRGKEASTAVEFDPYDVDDANTVVETWAPFTLALNVINRSMGQRDFYPFVMSPAVAEKLTFVHAAIRAYRKG